jgi:hypothetical protein
MLTCWAPSSLEHFGNGNPFGFIVFQGGLKYVDAVVHMELELHIWVIPVLMLVVELVVFQCRDDLHHLGLPD